jgi:hypothetical protein
MAILHFMKYKNKWKISFESVTGEGYFEVTAGQRSWRKKVCGSKIVGWTQGSASTPSMLRSIYFVKKSRTFQLRIAPIFDNDD